MNKPILLQKKNAPKPGVKPKTQQAPPSRLRAANGEVLLTFESPKRTAKLMHRRTEGGIPLIGFYLFPPGSQIPWAWVNYTAEEARQIRDALSVWLEELKH
jgi:hypothetical protein